MSYCRFSSDNWKSDVYCWHDVGGWFATHVAARRIVGCVPQTDWRGFFIDKTITAKQYAHQCRRQGAWLDKAKRKPIGLPHDGAYFQDRTRAAFLRRLLSLRKAGYHVPDSTIRVVRAEIADAKRKRKKQTAK